MPLAPAPLLPAGEHAYTVNISSSSLGCGAGSYAPFSSLLYTRRHKFRRNSRCVIARIIQRVVEEQGTRRFRGGVPSWDTRETRKSPPWESPRKVHTRIQTEREEEEDDDAHQERFETQAQFAAERNRHIVGSSQRNFASSKDAPNLNAVRPRPYPNPPSADAEDAKTAMARIVEKLRNILAERGTPQQVERELPLHGRTAGALILPKPNQDIFSIAKNWSTPDHPIPEPGRGILDAKFPWERDEVTKEEQKAEKERRVKPPSVAELTIPPPELKRLRTLSVGLTRLLKIGRLGVTENIATNIKQKWRTCELVKVKCEGPAALSMRKTQEDLERLTGGVVISRAGGVAVLYRGRDFAQPMTTDIADSVERKLEGLILTEHGNRICGTSTFDESKKAEQGEDMYMKSTLDESNEADRTMDEPSEADIHWKQDYDYEQKAKVPLRTRIPKAPEQSIVGEASASSKRLEMAADPHINREHEMVVESILGELGPRFEEWTGSRPLPVDADLLPVTIPNYQPPFRLLPYGIKPKLSNAEMTNLRRLARPLAPHFALGRNKGHEGLAAAIVKLWEKSEIAKVVVKRGVQNTSNERMAEEIKRLTGGVLLSRDKQFITLYRGKDFLPQSVAAALAEREVTVRALQEEEETARADRSVAVQIDTGIRPSVAVTVENAAGSDPSWVLAMDSEEQIRLKGEAAKTKRLAKARQIERKLAVALEKKEKAQQELAKVEAFLKPINKPPDAESITEEERFMFRKLGLRMRAFLLVGRRGVFDGVVENMHLHWKHRELVKIIVKERDPVKLQEDARMLEAESGGVLVAVVSTSKGQAIIVYRGKNYQRPTELRPRNLLNKRAALKRSIEIQRRVSLSGHIEALEQQIFNMKAGLSQMDPNELDELHELAEDDCASFDSESLESEDGVLENRQQGEVTMLTGSGVSESNPPETQTTKASARLEREKLKKLCMLGPIYRAEALTNRERLKLRKEALTRGKTAQFHVGKSNVLTGLAKAIRIYLLNHPLVKIGVKGRGRGTSLQDLVHELEDLTGGVLVSQEPNKIIMYRGWMHGEEIPKNETYEELSPELRAALEAEEDWEDDSFDDDYLVENGGEASDNETDEDEEDEDQMMGMRVNEDDISDEESDIDDEDSDYILGMYFDQREEKTDKEEALYGALS